MSEVFTKRRESAPAGSVPERLQMFPCEVRFYREVAPRVGVRVPACYRAEDREGATLLELEDLSSWQWGASPVAAAATLADLHRRWEGKVLEVWPWLAYRDVGDLVERLYDETWPTTRQRSDLTPAVRELGDHLVGQVVSADRRATAAGPVTLVHGDASARNMRTSPTGEIALLDWEDLGAGPGISDLAWLVVSSVEPAEWNRVLASYDGPGHCEDSLPAAAVQALLSLNGEGIGSDDAREWVARLEETARRL